MRRIADAERTSSEPEPTDRILLVECDPGAEPRDGRLLRAFSRRDCTISVVCAGQAAVEAVSREAHLLVLLDVHARPRAGLRLLQDLRARRPSLRAAVLTAAPDLASALDFLRLGAFDYLAKPVTPAALQALLERARAQDGLRQEGWLDALHALAPGLVHELRNPLSSVLASSQLLARHLAPHDRARKYADIIREEALQLESFLSRIAEFGRLDPRDADGTMDLRASVEQALRDAHAACAARRVRTVLRWDPGTPPARGNPVRVAQVCAELVRNALDAMPEGGTLTVTSRPPSEQDGGIHVEFADTGTGMTPEVQRRAFEPFFSTRPRALGIGLPLARAIARAQGGALRLDPPAAEGARLVLVLSVLSTP